MASNKTGRRRKSTRKRGSGTLWWGLLAGVVLTAVAYILVSYFFFVTPLSFRWRAMFGDPDYPEGYDIMGIDISHYQSTIDWDRLRNAKINGRPVRFVIIKASEGVSIFDENFNDNFHWARQNDMIRGAYHYFKPATDATRQAEYFLKQVHLLEGDMPPILDIEERGNKPLKQFQDDVLTWLEIVQSFYGVAPIIYTGYKFKIDYLNQKVFDEYPFWIAHYYQKKLKYKGEWTIWQYTDCGKVDGIEGYVDLNIFNGDLKALHHLTIQPDSAEPLE